MRKTTKYWVAGGLLLALAGTAATAEAQREGTAATSAARQAEYARTIEAMKPPKRARPVVAVLAHNNGAETTDFLVPYGVLAQSGLADVMAVAPTDQPIRLRPSLRVQPQSTLAAFDERYPDGADYVIVPAMRSDDPTMLAWIQAQAARGATIVGICAGTMVLSQAGLLKHRAGTGYWLNRDELRRANPGMKWVSDRRFVADRGIVTTTGITASLPVSLALVEAIGGRTKAAALARELGAEGWDDDHDSSEFDAAARQLVEAASAKRMERPTPIGVAVADGVDEIVLAFVADAFSRPHGTLAVTVSASDAPIRTKRGLTLLPDRVSGAKNAPQEMAPTLTTGKPADAMDKALEAIVARSGKDIANLVALQMEYPQRKRAARRS